MNNAVEICQVSHCYGKTQALDEISLSLPMASTFALVGPDGVGKSTLLSLIAGMKRLQQGDIRVFGENLRLAKAREALARRIAFMPQGLGYNLYPTLSIDENIDFHAGLFSIPKTERKQRIERLLAATDLLRFRARAAGKLSGGMKQKLSLCCALVHQPELLILDEPTTGVDPLSRRQFWQLIAQLRQETPQMTVIVATAYIDEAAQFEQLIAMNDGKLLLHAPTKQIIAKYGKATHHTDEMQAISPLEYAYHHLLPQDKRGNLDLSIPPFQAQAGAPPAMQAERLSKHFGEFTAVDKVSFTIEKGEIFGFLGSNGCGKSTTMKMLTGLLEPSEGSAQILGETIEAGSMAMRKRVGYMSQAFSLYEEMSVRRNLAMHATLYGLRGKVALNAIEDALKRYQLSTVADNLPRHLSLGIRQRLQLAAACLHRPEVLILDEPTSGVDPAARDLFWEELIRLSRQERLTIFVSTHFMSEAARCDRISFMHRGRVLDMGRPRELCQRQQATNLEEAFIRYLEQTENAQEALNPKNSPSSAFHDLEQSANAQVLKSENNPENSPSSAFHHLEQSASAQALKSENNPENSPPSAFHHLKQSASAQALKSENKPEHSLPSAFHDLEQHTSAQAIKSENNPEKFLSSAFHHLEQHTSAQALKSENNPEHSPPSAFHHLEQSASAKALKSENNPENSPSSAFHHLEQHTSTQALKSENNPENSLSSASPSKHLLNKSQGLSAWFALLFTFAKRESKELLRDPVRLFFALFGPILITLTAAAAISFDIRSIHFAVFNQDNGSESRALLAHFRGSTYFMEQAPVASSLAAQAALKSGSVALVIEIPTGFSKNVLANAQPEVQFRINGSEPFLAENIKGMVLGIVQRYGEEVWQKSAYPIALKSPINIEPRFAYNQDFKSIYAITPSVIMIALMLIPVMMTTLGVVREKEIGSISNLYTSPASVAQFLLGKQLPYLAAGLVNFLLLVALAICVFSVPIRGSFWAMLLGAVLLIFAVTAFGLLISSLISSQVAAMASASILTIIPAMNFSGMLYPVSTITGSGRIIATLFPAAHFQRISLGAFTKAQGFSDFLINYAALLGFGLSCLALAILLLRKQET